MRIAIQTLMNGEDVLFGVAAGRACLSRLLESADEPEDPEVVYLDFTGVASATVSFLREGPLAFREILRSKRSNLYPVFANALPAVADSLAEFLSAERDAVFTCDLAEDDGARNVRVLGRLEPKQDLTYRAVASLTEATAGDLVGRDADQSVGITAWNNRLAALAAKGLLVEVRRGRSKAFRVTLQEDS